MTILFHKYQGTGNDFIIVEEGSSGLTPERIARLCDRRFGVGADGLMWLEKAEGYDFRMVYYNSDGQPSSMCGNGGRCLVKYAREAGWIGNQCEFVAVDGEHNAHVDETGEVWLQMIDTAAPRLLGDGSMEVFTGSPHLIIACADSASVDVAVEGARIRYSDEYAAEGINVNFVAQAGDGSLVMRTYERGVEGETHSCGTGVTAAALAFASPDAGRGERIVETRGGKLRVQWETSVKGFQNIWLIGPALKTFEGSISL